MSNFFVSYTQADQKWAEWIAQELQAHGYGVLLAAWHFPAGSNFVVEMKRALAKSERVIAVLSPDYLTSPYGEAEWAYAVSQDPLGTKRRLVPVLVRETPLPPLLATTVHIRLTGISDSGVARERLLNGVRALPGPWVAVDYPGAGA